MPVPGLRHTPHCWQPIVEERGWLTSSGGEVISQPLSYNRVIHHCLRPFSYASLEKDRHLSSLTNAIATNRHPYAIALHACQSLPTDKPYCMPRVPVMRLPITVPSNTLFSAGPRCSLG